MQIRGIDELNTLSKPPKEYFGEMDLTKAQIEERIQFTEDAKEEFLLSMELMSTMSDYGGIDYDRAKRQLEDRLALLIDTYVTMDAYLRQYASDSAQNFVDATRRNVDKEWYFSEDRALYNAENSANDTLNYKDYVKAIEDGYTHKKWLTERDPRVRKTHAKLEGKTIGIMDYFVVGNALMRFPKDYELAYDAPEETVNCRCAIKYLNKEPGVENRVDYGILKLPDEHIFRTLSAAARNYSVMNLENGEIYKFAEGTRITNVQVFAGKGSSTPYRKAYVYAEKYGGRAEDWQHVKGYGTLDTPDGLRDAEVHWSQCEGYGKHDHFVKRWLD